MYYKSLAYIETENVNKVRSASKLISGPFWIILEYFLIC